MADDGLDFLRRQQDEIVEFYDQHADYTGHWYREHADPLYEFEPYNPEGRFYTNRLLLEDIDVLYLRADFYHRNGIPHEVSTPGGWRSFRLWMLEVARSWWQTVDRPALNPESFGDIYERGNVNFFQVMRSRVDRQVKYAVWTNFARRRHWEALTMSHEGYDRSYAIRLRQEGIMYSLCGMDGSLVSGDDSQEAESFARFLRSPAVRLPWEEFGEDWLASHHDTSNPKWNQVQSILANPDLATYRRRAYGVGIPDERRRLDKTNWSYEDHAIRFIISVYHLGVAVLAEDGIGPDDPLSGWRSCLFKQTNTPDIEDRHWFGFCLLMLLTVSWQHNVRHPTIHYNDRLVPAIYPDYAGGDFSFPDTEVGMVNLSPLTPWIIYPPYECPFDFHTTASLGVTQAGEHLALEQRESETELADNGGRLPGHPPRDE
ncbi:uncharacterized protein F4807DRAFT_468920 [Annulohypoxylon truncatum]|uniref:uncharacterized protein n=1 Tax=Annulohypoxylon truncatum TaxID=327061 RepID=UPI002008B0AE|nr:uncharacterized protein F4807DRAFT_468920 [Annulohypoxylon truncatum]KAI1208044.1 hypothetical protein F4807DRAFT_468920 [Annulohypoxylon truncatum]